MKTKEDVMSATNRDTEAKPEVDHLAQLEELEVIENIELKVGNNFHAFRFQALTEEQGDR